MVMKIGKDITRRVPLVWHWAGGQSCGQRTQAWRCDPPLRARDTVECLLPHAWASSLIQAALLCWRAPPGGHGRGRFSRFLEVGTCTYNAYIKSYFRTPYTWKGLSRLLTDSSDKGIVLMLALGASPSAESTSTFAAVAAWQAGSCSSSDLSASCSTCMAAAVMQPESAERLRATGGRRGLVGEVRGSSDGRL